MGQPTEQISESSIPALPMEVAPLHVIRTETVLSRLPMHNLSKKGAVNIHITRKNVHGEIDLSWRVSPNPAYGAPRQLAYKLDTLLINKHIDQLGRPLPKILKLGSLTEICKELGSHKTEVKRALYQNATTAIAASLRYTGRDGTEHHLEAVFTRYSVVWTGKKLPDGTSADAVHLVLSDPYWDVLNNAPVRPLDYAYLKALPPAAQRFYEILSYKMFAGLKYQRSPIQLLYSDYCLFSAQQRYTDYEHVKKQMYKVHRPHMQSGYLMKVRYDAVLSNESATDWLMHYTPGPKAYTEYAAFTHKHGIGDEVTEDLQPAEHAGATLGATDPIPGQAQSLVARFYLDFHGIENATPSSKDLEHACRVIRECGFERAAYLVDFSHRAASKSQYRPQTFGGILHYAPQAMAAYENQRQQETMQHTTAQGTHLVEQYVAYRQEALRRFREALPSTEYVALEDQARTRLIAEKTPAFALGLAVRVAVDQLLEARAGLPSFAIWRQQQNKAET